jgi:hypothetical protein
MITQRAKWMIESPSRPLKVAGIARAMRKIRLLIQVSDGRIGVTTFIP